MGGVAMSLTKEQMLAVVMQVAPQIDEGVKKETGERAGFVLILVDFEKVSTDDFEQVFITNLTPVDATKVLTTTVNEVTGFQQAVREANKGST